VSTPSRGAAADVTPRRGSRHLHALLDSILPGLGHLVGGRRRLGLAFIVPVGVLVLATAAILLIAPTASLLAIALDPSTIVVLFGLQLVILAWRAAAVWSSLMDGRFPRLGRRDTLPVVALAVLLIVPQAYAGILTEVAREEADRIIPVEPQTTGAWVPPSTAPSFDPSAQPGPSGSVGPSASPTVPRQNVLIIGVDQGVGRNTYLTDTMIVVSLDPVSETVSMVSIPRDMVDVPLPNGRTFSGKINSLVSYARHHPGEFPGANGDGEDVLMAALGTLLNLRIDHFAQVNLGGFIRVVDTLGGVNVNVQDGFCDPTYDEYGFSSGFAISPGYHHLNGQQALAYARVRKAAGESDFTRAARQQEILSGVRDAVKSGGFLRDPIGLLQALGQTVTTNIPRSIVPGLADVATRVGRSQTYREVIDHPLVRSGFDGRGSILIPDVEAIRKLSAALFPQAGTVPPAKYQVPQPKGSAKGSGVSTCKPAPTPTPKPTTKPTPKPSPSVTPSHSPSVEPTPSETASSAP
jgi:LCP family protein required for cell wall assembly